jgi:hypothetical protein
MAKYKAGYEPGEETVEAGTCRPDDGDCAAADDRFWNAGDSGVDATSATCGG